MKRNAVLAVVAAVITCLAVASSQAMQAPRGGGPRGGGQGGGQQQPSFREDGLDPTPIDAATDPNIDLFVGDWHSVKPRMLYGKLKLQDILTKLDSSDPVHPLKRGAVLTSMTSLSHATLVSGTNISGRAPAGDRQVFYTVGGSGTITVNGKSYDVKEGVGFTLTPDFDFKLGNTGKDELAFYVRAELLPANYEPSPDITVVNRFDNDRRVGAHWAHICNGGPNGMTLCTIAPRTMPQPHSHPIEEVWLMVKGESILSLGKNIRRMTPGQAYKIPPTGVTAHSNFNLNEEPVQMIYMGPAQRAPQPGVTPSPGGALGSRDFSRLDNRPFDAATEQDVSMFMGNWHDAFPRIVHGNLYFRDMLTALQGADPLHPARKGAVLTNAEAVSFAQLEPGATAHPVEGELKGIQQTFVVQSGTGTIAAAGKTVELSRDKSFIITPGMDFKLKATGANYLTFYVISERIAEGFAPRSVLEVLDHSREPQTTAAWVNKERPLIGRPEGLSQYGAVVRVEQGAMTMSRPYSAAPGVEEIWIATDGDMEMLFGKELRRLPAGTAYRVPSTGYTAHANINVTANTGRFLYMVK